MVMFSGAILIVSLPCSSHGLFPRYARSSQRKQPPAVIKYPSTLLTLCRSAVLMSLLFSPDATLGALAIQAASAQASHTLLAGADQLLQQGKDQLEAGQLNAASELLQ